MIEKFWFTPSVASFLLWPLLWPFSLLFRVVVHCRTWLYRAKFKPSYLAPVPVVIVGNITVGGNGKTPVVVWLIEQLQAKGYHPGVVSRGYGGHAPHYPYHVTADTSAALAGDEAVLIAQRTGVPIIVAPHRSNAAEQLLTHNVDVIISDDGLQHYALARDIELVVIDGQRRFGNAQYLPLGPLREGLTRLQTVDFCLCNGHQAQPNEIPMQLIAQHAINLCTGEQRSLEQLDQLVAIAGIGHPQRFFDTLEHLKAPLIHCQGFADHHDFQQTELEQISQQGQHLIMTEKDAVKCRSFAQQNWWYLPITAHLPSDARHQILDKIETCIHNKQQDSLTPQ